MVKGQHEPRIAILRGRIAETCVLKDIERAMPPGMQLFRNGDICYFNRRYQHGTEVDGIQVFYGDLPYLELAIGVIALNHVEVHLKNI